jgi:hypothetical protein
MGLTACIRCWLLPVAGASAPHHRVVTTGTGRQGRTRRNLASETNLVAYHTVFFFLNSVMFSLCSNRGVQKSWPKKGHGLIGQDETGEIKSKALRKKSWRPSNRIRTERGNHTGIRRRTSERDEGRNGRKGNERTHLCRDDKNPGIRCCSAAWRSRKKRRERRLAGAAARMKWEGDQDRWKPNDQENSELEKEFQTPGVAS